MASCPTVTPVQYLQWVNHSKYAVYVQAPYLILVEVAECESTSLSTLPAKQLDVSVKSAGL